MQNIDNAESSVPYHNVYFIASVMQHSLQAIRFDSKHLGQLVVGFYMYSYMTAGCQQISGLSCDCARGVESLLPTILIMLRPQESFPPMTCRLPMYLNLRGTGCLYVTP